MVDKTVSCPEYVQTNSALTNLEVTYEIVNNGRLEAIHN